MNKLIGVIGSGNQSKRDDETAFQVGRLIAESQAILVCGGLSGVMEAACRGASLPGGRAVGILPGDDRADANPYVTIPIPTGMGIARNVLVVKTSDVLIALGGGSGTLSEIAIALKLEKPVIDLGGWKIKGTKRAAGPEEAVRLALSLAGCTSAE
ncbi:MAG: TIGR00725 family protein [Deltaproteobacteria bacterium]|nr:TIGR00725 family protein [Deltaproteobacteria bacterium]